MSIYYVSPDRVGHFDVIFFFGVLYHLRHPLLALDKLSSVTRSGGDIFIESAISDDYSPYRGGFGHGHGVAVVMEFYPENQFGNNPSNWWSPTLNCLIAMLSAAGYQLFASSKMKIDG